VASETPDWVAEHEARKTWVNKLFYGDNLDVLHDHTRIPEESVDLVYLDPPFNSDRVYNVLFGAQHGDHALAQIEAFDDTWTWTPETERLYFGLVGGEAPPKVADALEAMHALLEESDFLAYLVMMAPRLVALRRVLKPTGSIYLHCDPTASHYLKMLMDAVFGPTSFRNEIIWKRTSAHSRLTKYGPVHDVVLFYTKTDDWVWNPQHTEYDPEYVREFYRHTEEGTGRLYRLSDVTSNRPGGSYEWKGKPPPGSRYWGYSQETMEQFEKEGRLIYSKKGIPSYKRYLDEMDGPLLQDVWTDIKPIGARAAERLGYPTQKPVALLKRIIEASSRPGDLVLDPFCGCGTTVDAAESLGRRWIGIDVTYIAIDLIRRRLEDSYHGDAKFEIDGIPRDTDGAEALFQRSPFDFERWAVSLVYGQPNEKQVGDRGIDGVIRFLTSSKFADKKSAASSRTIGRCLVSVKGGRQINPAFVRDLLGTVNTEKAEMGVLITLTKPTKGMIDAANHAGGYEWPINGQSYPKIQLATIDELLGGHRVTIPTPITPYLTAPKNIPLTDQLAFGDDA
jgi:DNA modification methylase